MSLSKVFGHLLAMIVVAECCGVAASSAQTHHASIGTWGVSFADQDKSVSPGDDFYRYQNGRWLDQVHFEQNQKADAYWRDVRLLSVHRLQTLFDEMEQGGTSLTAADAKVVAFYQSYMDESIIEARGLSPLAGELDALRKIRSKSALAEFTGRVAGPETLRLQRVYGPTPGWAFFRFDAIDPDRGNPDRCAVYVGAGGLVLPGPEYYLEAQFAVLRDAYVRYVQQILGLLQWPEPERRAREILALETAIARVTWSHEQMLNQKDTYNPITVAELKRFAPGFAWAEFMRGAGLERQRDIVIDAKSSFPKIARIFSDAPLELLKARQAFGLADQRVSFLDTQTMKAAIAFRGEALGNGTFLGAAPRKVRAEKDAEAILPDLVSSLYVRRYSSVAVKEEARKMAELMRAELTKRISQLSWLSDKSRALALEKLAAMKILVGFPDHFEDYSELQIRNDDLYGNYIRSAAYQWEKLRGRLDLPRNDSLWSIRAEYPTFNYSFTSNVVEIPAALLVPPFFDLNADPAVNYGSAGSIIGSMIVTPFFTKQGLSYDRDGRLSPLVAGDEVTRFENQWNRIARQYAAVEAMPGHHLKGTLLADEALADLAGLSLALGAYHATPSYAEGKVLDGYTGDQRFFLGRAQMWRAKFVDSFILSQIATGSNEPPFMRVNGIDPNMDEWYAAFGVKAGDRLYIDPESRARIW